MQFTRKEGSMSRLIEKLAEKVYEQLQIDCDTETFVRTYAGRNQKATGAPLWLMQPKNNSIVMIGSTLPASYLVKKRRVFVRGKKRLRDIHRTL